MTKFWLVAVAIAAMPAFAVFDDVTREKYPDADAVLVDGLEDVVYRPDGTYTTVETQVAKVLTEKGRRDESEIVVHYNARYGKTMIESVEIIDESGVARKIDLDSTMKEMVDNNSAGENIYDPMSKKVVCSIPGLKVGEVMRYTIRRETFQSRIENAWADIMVLEWQYPIVKQTVRVTEPVELPIKRAEIRNPLGNVTESVETRPDGRRVRTWVATNSPQAFEEPDMPPMYTQVQVLKLSTAENWQELSRWYWNLCLPHIEKADAAITNKVAEIGRDYAKLYKWVAQEIRYMGLTLEDTSPGYSPHDVDVTFHNRYGVCRDKAGLLVAMLRVAGYDAFPVLIHNGAKMDPVVPMPYFNHAIVAVYAPDDAAANQDGYILMDPTDESSRDIFPAYLSDRSYLVARPEGEGLLTSQSPSPEANSVKIAANGVLAKDGSLLYRAEVAFAGMNDTAYRGALLRKKADDRRKFFERILFLTAPGAEILDFSLEPENLQDTTKPLKLAIEARIPEVLLDGNTRSEFVAPLLSKRIGAVNWLLEGKTALEKRRFALDIASTALVDEELVVKLDDVVGEAVSLPAKVDFDGVIGYTSEYSTEGDTLRVHRRAAVNAVELSPAEYLAVRDLLAREEAAERARPVFAKNNLAGANVRYREYSESVDFTGPRSWVVTNHCVKEILTYDGKKNSAELTFAYNPTWKQVDVVSARVTSPDGKKTTALTEKERNVFDAKWAASAPRYPAAKELVVTLPAVEVGSVIEYTVVETVKDAPLGFYGNWYLDVREPTDLMTIRVGDDKTIVKSPKLLKSETMTADGRLWRERKTVSKRTFADALRCFRAAADVPEIERPSKEIRALVKSARKAGGEAGIKIIRDYVAKNVRVSGPGFWDVPVSLQLTDPAVVLKENYATRVDYIRALTALLREAGYEADVVFSSYDADIDPRIQKMIMSDYPNPAAFGAALVRVTLVEGSFLGIGGEETVYFLGTENEHSPIGATLFARSHYLDPETGHFATIDVPSGKLRDSSRVAIAMKVDADGTAAFDYAKTIYGSEVGDFRREYSEMLPEDRARHFRDLLSGISQAAVATTDLKTDVTGYPATLAFGAKAADFATVGADSITVTVPEFNHLLFSLTGTSRTTPIGVPASGVSETSVSVTFPKGYTEIEHLPDEYVFENPATGAPWVSFAVTHTVSEGVLTVTLRRNIERRKSAMLDKSFFPLVREWTRESSSRPNRTIVVRRAK